MNPASWALAVFTALALLVALSLLVGVANDPGGVPGITDTGTTTEVDR